MIVIIKNIPAKTTEDDIEDFLAPALKGGWLGRNGMIESIIIKTHKDTLVNNVIKHQALVRIMPDSVGNRVIKLLNRKRIHGRPIIVTQYHVRNWHNDPRVNRHQLNEELHDRRKGERRRRYVEIDLPGDHTDNGAIPFKDFTFR